MPAFTIRQAHPVDLDDVVAIVEARYAWLLDNGIDQWADLRPFGPVIADKIMAGQTWLLFDRQIPIGTLSMSTVDEAMLWTSNERDDPAFYVGMVVVHQFVSGRQLGRMLMDWAASHARSQGMLWLRWAVAANNTKLCEYSASIATPVRTVTIAGRGAVALFQASCDTAAADPYEVITTLA